MRKLVALCLVAAATVGMVDTQKCWGQDGADELVRAFCVDAAAGEQCSDDRLEVVFADQLENSVFAIETFEANMTVQAHVVLEAVTDEIRGYSFGVSNDGAVLGIRPDDIDLVGTPTETLMGMGFESVDILVGGVRVAVLLSFSDPVVLPLERAIVLNVKYTMLADPGPEGTVLAFTGELGTPPTAVVLTVDELSPIQDPPAVVPPFTEQCTDGMDNDDDTLVDGDDPDCIARNSSSRVPRTVVDGLIRTVRVGPVPMPEPPTPEPPTPEPPTPEPPTPEPPTPEPPTPEPPVTDLPEGFESGLRVAIVDGAAGTAVDGVVPYVVADGSSVTANIMLQSAIAGCVADPGTCDATENFVVADPNTGIPTGFGCSDGMDNDADGLTDTMDPDCRGVQGWSMSIATDDCFNIASATTSGTVAGLLITPGGLRDLQSFEKSETVDATRNNAQQGAVSAVVLSLSNPVILPQVSESLVLVLTGVLEDASPGPCAITVLPPGGDGLRGAGEPVSTAVTFAGTTIVPFVTNATVAVGDVTEPMPDVVPPMPDVDPPMPDVDPPMPDVDPPMPDPTVGCPDYAFYFGNDTSVETVQLAGGNVSIGMRNVEASSGFQLGVKVTNAGDSSTWEFAGTLGGTAVTLVELLIADLNAEAKDPVTPNTATGAALEIAPGSVSVAQGGAIGFAGQGDLLLIDTITEDSGIGGPGFTVGYVADISGTDNAIAPSAAEGCGLNEILVVTFADVPVGELPFNRGDADGNGRINIRDAMLIIQSALGNVAQPFACDDVYDADDDGTISVKDGLPALLYVFQKGAPLPAPFRTCAIETTADALSCTQSNCQ